MRTVWGLGSIRLLPFFSHGPRHGCRRSAFSIRPFVVRGSIISDTAWKGSLDSLHLCSCRFSRRLVPKPDRPRPTRITAVSHEDDVSRDVKFAVQIQMPAFWKQLASHRNQARPPWPNLAIFYVLLNKQGNWKPTLSSARFVILWKLPHWTPAK